MYTTHNFHSKKELREAVERGVQVGYYQPNSIIRDLPRDGTIYVEGPHYPEPHRWYATCKVQNGVIVKVN